MNNDTLRIKLEARPEEWQPSGPDGPVIYTHVVSADGFRGCIRPFCRRSSEPRKPVKSKPLQAASDVSISILE